MKRLIISLVISAQDKPNVAVFAETVGPSAVAQTVDPSAVAQQCRGISVYHSL